MLRRPLTFVFALPLVAVLSACSTVTGSDDVARVDDATLTIKDFKAQLTDAGATEDVAIPGDAARAEINRWIQEQLVDADEIAAIYDEGLASADTLCVDAIVVSDEAEATRVEGELAGGADFDEVFAVENLDQQLAASGGALACITADQVTQAVDTEFVQVAATLSADEPLGVSPLFDQVGTEVAWVVVEFRPFSDLAAEDVALVTSSIDVSARAAEADIHVDSRYGTFDVDTGLVVGLG